MGRKRSEIERDRIANPKEEDITLEVLALFVEVAEKLSHPRSNVAHLSQLMPDLEPGKSTVYDKLRMLSNYYRAQLLQPGEK